MKKILYLGLMLSIFSCQLQNNKNQTVTSNVNIKAIEFITAKNTGEKLALRDTLKFVTSEQPDENFPTIFINDHKTFQSFEGIGGALTDAAAETFYKLPADMQKEVIVAYYSNDKGIGYSLARTHIHSCDFSSNSYTYVAENDTNLVTFSIEHDLKYRIPLIKEALKATDNKLKIYASPWSPPSWMKSNNNMLHGGKLKPECYKAWANYFVRFINEYQKQGIPIWGITVQNEPMAEQTWESCIFTANEEKDFVKKHLGPTLWSAGLKDVHVMIWDHNRGLMYQRAQAAYDDVEASKYIWGMAFHWYAGDHFENVSKVNEAFPEKHLLHTEACEYPFSWENVGQWYRGENYAKSIINDLNHGAEGWTDWNILLDEKGGPNHVGNYCLSPIVADTRDGSLHYMSSYYYIGHFSKFIRPGAVRVSCTSSSDNLLATAFKNLDNSISVVIMNSSDNDLDYQVWIAEKAAPSKIPAHSIITVVLK